MGSNKQKLEGRSVIYCRPKVFGKRHGSAEDTLIASLKVDLDRRLIIHEKYQRKGSKHLF